ncbi:hypothetical protein UlMin_026152 [Ulmus minor]
MSEVNKAPQSLSNLIRYTKGKEDKIAVVVGIVKVPCLKVTALRFIETARAMIEKVLLKGPKNTHEAVKHFEPALGVRHSHTKPYVWSKCRKFEKARGKRIARASGFELGGSLPIFAIVVPFKFLFLCLLRNNYIFPFGMHNFILW